VSSEEFELPEGWATSTLGEVAQLVKDKVDPALVPDARYVGLEHVESHTMRILGNGRGAEVRSTKARFSAGDVLYGKLRPYLNKVAQPDFDGICSTDFLVFRESDLIDPGYLAQFLNQLWVAERANHLSTGVELPRVGWKGLSSFPISYPLSKQSQRAIVRSIEEARMSVGSASTHLAGSIRAVERFRQAVLAAACSGRLTADWRSAMGSGDGRKLLQEILVARREALGRKFRVGSPSDADKLWDIPEAWTWITPDEISDPSRALTYGVIKLGESVVDGVPTLRSSDVRWLRIDSSHVKRISRGIADNYSRTYLKGREVLVTVRGTLGGVAVVPKDMAGWNISREVAVIPVVEEMYSPYVSVAIGSPQCQQWMSGVAKGVAYTGVNIEDLKNLPIPIPPLDEQREIADRVYALVALADDVAKRIATARASVQRSSQAVLSKAFRGELALVTGPK